MLILGGDSSNSMVELRASDQKIAGPYFDLRAGIALLRPRQRQFTFISYSDQAVYTLWWPSLMKDLQTEFKKGCFELVRLDRRVCLVHTNE